MPIDVFPFQFTQLADAALAPSDGTQTETLPVTVAEPSQALELIAPLIPEPVTLPAVVEQPSVPETVQPEFEHHSEVATLLADGNETIKPVERTEAAPTVVATAPDTYDFKAPDDVRMTDDDRGRITATFRDLGFDQAKATTALTAYYAEQRRQRDSLLQSESRRHHDAFMGMRREWLNSITGTPATIEKDGQQVPNPGHVAPHPILGQPGALEAVKRMRDKIVPAGDKDGWKEMCGLTGAGDHPALALAVYRAHEREEKLIAEYEAKIITAVAKALEPYQEGKAPVLRGKPVNDPHRDPNKSPFENLYDRNAERVAASR